MVYKSHASLLSLAASMAEPINLVSCQKGAFGLSCQNETFKTHARTGLYPDCLSRKGNFRPSLQNGAAYGQIFRFT